MKKLMLSLALFCSLAPVAQSGGAPVSGETKETKTTVKPGKPGLFKRCGRFVANHPVISASVAFVLAFLVRADVADLRAKRLYYQAREKLNKDKYGSRVTDLNAQIKGKLEAGNPILRGGLSALFTAGVGLAKLSLASDQLNGVERGGGPILGQLAGLDSELLDQLGGLDSEFLDKLGGLDSEFFDQLGGLDSELPGQLGGLDFELPGQLGGLDSELPGQRDSSYQPGMVPLD